MTERKEGRAGRIRAVRLVIDRGVGCYDPHRHFERLLGIEHDGVWVEDQQSRKAAIARLKRALRSERNRGRSGHWSYDLNRHIGLLQALKAEMAGRKALGPDAGAQASSADSGRHGPSCDRPHSVRNSRNRD